MLEKKWYVLYVKLNHEKKVTTRINDLRKDLEAFCPTRTEIRVWSDREKKILVPLLTRIVFIHAKESDRGLVFDIPGTINYLYENGNPGIVLSAEIAHLKEISDNPNVKGHEIQRFAPGATISLDQFGFENEAGVIQKTTKNNIWVVLKSLGFIVKLHIK